MTSLGEQLRLVTLGVVLGIALMLPRMFARDEADNAAIATARADVATAADVRAAAVETVTVHVQQIRAAAAESDRLADLVRGTGPTTLEVRLTSTSAPQIVTVPAVVVQKLRADSTTIARQGAHIVRLQALVKADSNVINRQSILIQQLETRRRCGPKCGATIAVLTLAAAKFTLDREW